MNLGQSKPTSFNDGIKLLEGYLADAGATYGGNVVTGVKKLILQPSFDTENMFDDPGNDGQFIAALKEYQAHKDDKEWSAAKKSAGIVAFETLNAINPCFVDGIDILKNFLSRDAVDSTGRNENVVSQAENLLKRYTKMNLRLNGSAINYTVRGQTPEIYATVADREITAKTFKNDLDTYFDVIADAMDDNSADSSLSDMFPMAIGLKNAIVKKNVALFGVVYSQTINKIVNMFYDTTLTGRSNLSSMLQDILPQDPMMIKPQKSYDLTESKVDFDALSGFLRGLDELCDKFDDRDLFPLENEEQKSADTGSETEEEETPTDDEDEERKNFDLSDVQSLFNYYGVGEQEDDEYLDDVKDVMAYERSLDRAERNADLEYARMTGDYEFGQTLNDTVESYLQSWRGLIIKGTIKKEHEAEQYEEKNR